MGSFANTLFTLLLGWLQGIVSAVWSAFTTENSQSWFDLIGRHWIAAAGVLCLIGLGADLCVYLFRWRPFKVWKSFFSRNRDTGEEPEEEDRKPAAPAANHSARSRNTSNTAIPAAGKAENRTEEPDLSQWEIKTERETYHPAPVPETPPLTTKAGYTVPADSPYRRPAKQSPLVPEIKEEQTDEAEAELLYGEKERPVALKPRKRRRISVNELFSNPEEELLEFDAPQNVIDSKKAYLNPVYPRGWKNSESSEDNRQ